MRHDVGRQRVKVVVWRVTCRGAVRMERSGVERGRGIQERPAERGERGGVAGRGARDTGGRAVDDDTPAVREHSRRNCTIQQPEIRRRVEPNKPRRQREGERRRPGIREVRGPVVQPSGDELECRIERYKGRQDGRIRLYFDDGTDRVARGDDSDELERLDRLAEPGRRVLLRLRERGRRHRSEKVEDVTGVVVRPRKIAGGKAGWIQWSGSLQVVRRVSTLGRGVVERFATQDAGAESLPGHGRAKLRQNAGREKL